uniref:Uncharacterized protein n=1 Tax=Cacopsylla melanoneura TaxID=428564 RepID=A0A8D9FDC9_9HEMI
MVSHASASALKSSPTLSRFLCFSYFLLPAVDPSSLSDNVAAIRVSTLSTQVTSPFIWHFDKETKKSGGFTSGPRDLTPREVLGTNTDSHHSFHNEHTNRYEITDCRV